MASASHRLESGYQEIFSDDEYDRPPELLQEADMHLDAPLTDHSLPYLIVPDQRRNAKWNHIEDLDAFFKKVYSYHQKHGFWCMFIESTLQLLQFVFVIVFITFLFSCVDYAILFKDKFVKDSDNKTHVKVKLIDAITPPGECLSALTGTTTFWVTVSLIFWAIRVVRVFFQLLQYLQVKNFYTTALHILPHELDNMTWHDVQQRLLEVQREHEMCVHKKELSELDVYHRILRHENYLVALVNKEVIPLKFTVPCIGQIAFLSSGLKYNLEAILFWGPWAPFENSWHLKEDFKKGDRTEELARQLSKSMMYIGLINLLLMPLILIWQFLFVIFSYADVVKREPGFLGSRMWSEYSRVHLRHFNELDHELNSRLCMGYRAATQYMNSFTSHITVVLAQNGVFFAGSFWVVLVGLTVWDEDFLAVEHIVTALAVLSMVLAVCRAAIPDEHMVWCPEKLMKTILQHIHYMPDHWDGCAHTSTVRDEFGNLFTYKFNHLLCEVLSPLVTPFILMLSLRRRSQEIVEFLCDNTVTVTGVGDICSFAQMDLRKHGNPQWTAVADPMDDESILPPSDEPPRPQQSEMGKTELSLAHFKLTNPNWNPDTDAGQKFLRGLTNHLENNLHSIAQGPLLKDSFHSFTSLNPMLALSHVGLRPMGGDMTLKGGGVTSAQGPLASLGPASFEHSMLSLMQSGGAPTWPPMSPVPSLEICAAQMSASALFMYEKRQVRSHYGTPSRKTSQYLRPKVLTNIQESGAETTPLLHTMSTR